MTQNRPVIILARDLPDMFTAALGQIAEVRVAQDGFDEQLFTGASIYLATGIDPVPADLIKQFPDSVGLIANIATGTDNIDLDAAAAKGLCVSNTPVVAEDTADLTMALLLASCRQLSFCERTLREGNWNLATARSGSRVHGKTLGIVGMGAIGQAVAKRAAAFNMTVLYHGPNRKEDAEATLGVQYRSTLAALLEDSDIVSLNCPLTAASRHMMNAETLGQMKVGAVLINTGRGPLIDEQALVHVLQNGHLSAAGLDVFEFEPEITPALLELDNVTLLPHIGSSTTECRMDMAMRAFQNIKQFLSDGKPADNCV